jgi:hypothetical protein
VALYSQPNFGEKPYSGGVCKLFGVGDYPTAASLGTLGGDHAASLRIGSDVSATLFFDENFTGRAETLTANNPDPGLLDRSLADNLIGSDTLSSLQVRLRTAVPSAPLLTPAANQVGQAPTSADSLVLAWRNTGGATKFEAELYQGPVAGTPWKVRASSTDQWWSIGSLPAGSYSWRVRGRVANKDGATYYSAWSTLSFTVSAGPAAPAPVAFPFADVMESGPNGWTATGLWRQAAVTNASGSPTTAWAFNNGASGDYADAAIRAGDLTSPPIALPAGTPAFLRFAYWNDTESSLPYFDQRWVQISVDGSPFASLAISPPLPALPLFDDASLAWLASPAVDLSAYAGHTLQVRFHFDIVDGALNSFAGWIVDDVSLTSTPPPSCPETPPNNTPAAGLSLAIGASASGEICPAGDVDYYKFTGALGDLVQADAVARALVPASPLDTVLTLMDGDGRSVLVENDDLQPGVQQDSRLAFRLPASGTYYLKVKAWDHPGAGGADYDYQVSLARVTDTTPPAVSLTIPASGMELAAGPIQLTLQATDSGSGVSRVDFYRHSEDWLAGAWTLLGTDFDSSDGWSLAYDPAAYPDGQRSSFYVRAYDWAGNSAGTVVWFQTSMLPAAYLPLTFK